MRSKHKGAVLGYQNLFGAAQTAVSFVVVNEHSVEIRVSLHHQFHSRLSLYLNTKETGIIHSLVFYTEKARSICTKYPNTVRK